MGAWGTAIYSDDIALETRDIFKEIIVAGFNEHEATAYMIEQNQELLNDPNDSCVFWLSLAHTQWKLGRLTDLVKDKAIQIIDEGYDLERWNEDLADKKKREKVLNKLKEQILSPQPEPKVLKKLNPRPKKYKIGDVFLVPLENDLVGAGRVLKMSGDTVFIELFEMKPIYHEPDIELGTLKTRPSLMTWCYDDHLRKKEWKIISNVPVPDGFEMPLFYTQDSSDRSYILIKCTDSHQGEVLGIVINKEERNNYAQYGIASPFGISTSYYSKLKELKLVD